MRLFFRAPKHPQSSKKAHLRRKRSYWGCWWLLDSFDFSSLMSSFLSISEHPFICFLSISETCGALWQLRWFAWGCILSLQEHLLECGSKTPLEGTLETWARFYWYMIYMCVGSWYHRIRNLCKSIKAPLQALALTEARHFMAFQEQQCWAANCLSVEKPGPRLMIGEYSEYIHDYSH